MFCPNCGEKLESQNQRFCASCGSRLQFTPIPEVPQEIPGEIQVTTPASTISVSESIPMKKDSQGSYSKRTFAFGFLSLVLAGIGFILEFLAFFRFVIPIYVFPRLPSGPWLLIIALCLHMVGIIFGVISKVSSSKARTHEIENALEKVGRVFGILGIIANAIPIVVINIALVIFNVPYSPPPGPYP
jgi:hypothetical protein